MFSLQVGQLCPPCTVDSSAAEDDLETTLLSGIRGSSGKSSALSFVVDAYVGGCKARALVDTGASVSFCADHFATTHSLKVVPDEDAGFRVRLGNGSTEPVKQRVQDVKVTLKDVSHVQDVYLLPLPTGIDYVIGMDFLTANDVWIHPASKKVLQLSGDTFRPLGNLISLTYLCTMDRIQQLESESDAFVGVQDGDDPLATPGIFTIDSEGPGGIELSVEVAGDDLYNKLL